jgi:uncharacterized RDD family membrane protein YckC
MRENTDELAWTQARLRSLMEIAMPIAIAGFFLVTSPSILGEEAMS